MTKRNSKDMEDQNTLTSLGNLAVTVAAQIKQAEENLKELRASEHDLLHDKLPAAMSNVGMNNFELDDGSSIKLQNVVKAAIPSTSAIQRAKGPDRDILIERRTEALKYLRKTKDGKAIIKQTVTIELGKGQNKLANDFIKQAKAAKLIFTKDESVHGGTLSKYVGELLEQNKSVPFETLGVYTGNIAKVTPAK
jgi:hypothetical protein